MDYVIGIDMGGTKIEGVLMNSKAKILKKYRVPTESDKSKNVVIGNFVKVIEELNVKKIKGVGIGTPGFVVNGKVQQINNVPCLLGVNLQKELAKRTGIKNIRLENDANCFALAEYMHGAGKGYKNMVGVIIGTGLGGGIVINGKLLTGATGSAGEIGHHIIEAGGPKCPCGGRGHFEGFCSGKQLTRRYIKARGKIKDPDPKKIFESKERIAQKIMKETISYLGIGLANLVNIFNPDVIVLGGGVSNLKFYKEVKASTKKFAIDYAYRNVKIVKNKLGDSSGVIGAGSLIL